MKMQNMKMKDTPEERIKQEQNIGNFIKNAVK